MLTVAELWKLIDSAVRPLPTLRVPLEDAVGRRLAENVAADADLPAFSRSSIDGFLVREGAGPGRFRIGGEVPPGAPAGAVPGPGEAWRIFTGSAVPDEGAALVMLEDAEVGEGTVVLHRTAEVRLIRKRGSQASRGERILAAGAKVTPGTVPLLAQTGRTRPLVSARPRVAHLSTGSELVPADEVPPPGSIRDTNFPLLAALIREAGAELVFHARVSESVEEAVAVLADQEADLLLLSGGAGPGASDGAAETLRRLGYSLRSERVNSRPGKPLIFALRDNHPAFGLPGNPLAHFVCFHLFIRRAIDRLAGLPTRSLTQVHLNAQDRPASDPRETWWPALVRARNGLLHATPLPWGDSSDLTGLPPANALLRVGTQPTTALAEALIFDRVDE